jgi:hypothetical protein
MSNARYLEIDSSYRDRKEWPQAGKFVVPISQTGRRGPIDAADPVSEAADENTWVANAFDVVVPGRVLSNGAAGLQVSDILPASGAATGSGLLAIILTCTAGHAQIANNYYDNAILTTTDDPIERSRIADYKYLGTTIVGGNVVDRLQVRLFNPLQLAIGTNVDIQDPTDLASTTSPVFFVPSGKRAPNAYPGTQIHNITLNQFRYVERYSATTHLLLPNTSTSSTATTTSGPTTGWLPEHIYAIRPVRTGWCGQLDISGWNPPPGTFINTKRSFNLPVGATRPREQLVGSFLEVRYLRSSDSTDQFTVVSSSSQMQLAVGSDPNDDFYVGCQIRLSGALPPPSGERRIITDYDGSSRTITVDPPFTVTPTAGVDNYQIICGGVKNPNDATACTQESRRIVKYVDYRDTAIATTANTISFSSTASDINGFYTGLFIRVDPTGANNLRYITDYVVTKNGSGLVISRVATVDRNFVGVPATPDFTITSGIVEGPFPFSLADQDVCILPFSYDNLNPFVFTGSQVSQQDVVCYEIELLNLILPNQTLSVAEGGLISYYPYVYVQLTNIDASGGRLKNIIYSNNPNATNMLFRAAVDDVPNPITSTFIKIDGDGAVQTIKFKPNDNLLFAVYMPDGEVFQTLEPEWLSPCIPNPKAQISAYFSIKRL